VEIPQALAHEWRREPEWLAALPLLAQECAALWGLELEEPVDTPHSLVVPAGDVVLKVNAPSHFEADHEAEALERWDGRGAVRVVARDDSRRAFLIERAWPGTRLWDTDVEEPDVLVELLPQLRHEPEEPHPFRFLRGEADRWAEEVPQRWNAGGHPFERSLLEYAVDVFRTVDRRAAWLVNQDLHGGNILRAEREPWLVIDPKPLLGERELDAVGLLRNVVVGNARGSIDRMLDALASLGLDRDRLRGWGAAHALAWGWDETSGWSATSIATARAISRA
jgi:streptomycin 6-kinase